MGLEPDPNSASPELVLSQALNQKIREWLEREGETQASFAKRLGLKQGTISALLRGRRRKQALDFYEDVAAVFQQPLSELIRDLEITVAASRARPHRRKNTKTAATDASHVVSSGVVAHDTIPSTLADRQAAIEERTAKIEATLEAILEQITTAYERFLEQEYGRDLHARTVLAAIASAAQRPGGSVAKEHRPSPGARGTRSPARRVGHTGRRKTA